MRTRFWSQSKPKEKINGAHKPASFHARSPQTEYKRPSFHTRIVSRIRLEGLANERFSPCSLFENVLN